jgi:hypothetical protein
MKKANWGIEKSIERKKGWVEKLNPAMHSRFRAGF